MYVTILEHCFFRNYTTFKIQYGVTHISGDGLNTIPVDEVIVHKDYQPSTEWNDIALLRVLLLSLAMGCPLTLVFSS